MEYPIFQSITNIINGSLNERNINVTNFKTWEETKINATGLEIFIDLSDATHYLKSLSINFDWDRFREAALARQMEGTDKHPILKSDRFKGTNVSPGIDIEMSWHFKEDRCQPSTSNGETNYRIQMASEWMDDASKKVNELLISDDIITRWHLEIDGDQYGKYLTAINLISYFQFSMSDLKSLCEVHNFVERKLTHLLYKAKKIIEIVDDSVVVEAA
ncbi:MAG: hypothetical protein WD381_01090 [Balneolaceae bacterium]